MPPSGPSAYKEVCQAWEAAGRPAHKHGANQAVSWRLQEIDYAGVRRSIIYRNAPLVDDDGYEVFSEDEPDRVQNAAQSAAELNPYANIRLQRRFRPEMDFSRRSWQC